MTIGQFREHPCRGERQKRRKGWSARYGGRRLKSAACGEGEMKRKGRAEESALFCANSMREL